MSATLERVAGSPLAWRAAAVAVFQAGQAMVEAGKPVQVALREWGDDMSARQRRFLHGPVLGQITEQARGEDGQRYAMPVWKELFRQQFLGSTFEMVNGRAVEIRNSTEGLGVRAYSEYIDQVIAEASTTWGVEFRFILDEREAVRYQAKSGWMGPMKDGAR